MQMSRLLDKSTLRKLYEHKLFSNPYLATIEAVMERNDESDDNSARYLKEFFVDLFFYCPENSEDYSEINKKVLQIFKICSDEKSDFEWQYLKKIPEAIRQISERLNDPNLFEGLQNEWTELFNSETLAISDMITIFDKKT